MLRALIAAALVGGAATAICAAPASALPDDPGSTATTGSRAHAERLRELARLPLPAPRPDGTARSASDGPSAGDPFGPAVTTDRSEVQVRALGDEASAKQRARTQLEFSGWQSAGRFVHRGDDVGIDVPSGVTGLVAVIGQWGTYEDLNGGTEQRVERALEPGANAFPAPVDGMVHLVDRAAEGSRRTDVVVTGGTAMPVYLLGSSDQQAFTKEVRTTTSPFSLVVGDRVVVEMQTPTMKKVLRKELDGGLSGRVERLDWAVGAMDRHYGLSRDATGVDHRSAQRILVATPDSYDGGYAYAGDGRVGFPTQKNGPDLGVAAENVITGFAENITWHELGHVYQPTVVRWGENLGEISNEIPMWELVSEQFGVDVLFDPSLVEDVRAYLELPLDERDWEGYDQDLVRAVSLNQLSHSFGPGFWQRLHQEDRVDAALGQQTPSTDAARAQRFALLAGRVADRDLSRFFTEWGFDLTDDTRSRLGELPPLEHEIWANLTSATFRLERDVPYSPPVGRYEGTASVALGARQVPDSLMLSGVAPGTAIGASHLDARTAGAARGTLATGLTAPDGTRNAAVAAVDVGHRTDLEFRGLGDVRVAVLALDRESGRVTAAPIGSDAVHGYFTDEYIGARWQRSDGAGLADASVLGTDDAEEFRSVLDGIRFRDGDVLTVRHREARNRLVRWDDGVQAAADGAAVQSFRVRGGRLVPVPASEVPAPRALVDSMDLLGAGDEVVSRWAVDGRSTDRPAPRPGAVDPEHADEQYLAARLVRADGTVVRSATVRGADPARRIADVFDGTSATVGSFLVIEHAEAERRLVLYADGVEQSAPTGTSQAFRVERGGLAPVPAAEVPAR